MPILIILAVLASTAIYKDGDVQLRNAPSQERPGDIKR